MTASDTIATLYKAILAHPFEDEPRLEYADALDERGDAALNDCERAEFIRLQIKSQVDFAPRVQLHGFLTKRGPDYFEFETDDFDTEGVTVGARVDVYPLGWARDAAKEHGHQLRKQKTHHGLLVKKLIDAGAYYRVALKKDEYSAKFPIAEAEAAEARMGELFRAFATIDYAELVQGLPSQVDAIRTHRPAEYPMIGPAFGLDFMKMRLNVSMWYERGFVSHLHVRYHALSVYAPTLKHYPITDVTVLDPPDVLALTDALPNEALEDYYRRKYSERIRWHFDE